jgi:hypothetical protein
MVAYEKFVTLSLASIFLHLALSRCEIIMWLKIEFYNRKKSVPKIHKGMDYFLYNHNTTF